MRAWNMFVGPSTIRLYNEKAQNFWWKEKDEDEEEEEEQEQMEKVTPTGQRLIWKCKSTLNRVLVK